MAAILIIYLAMSLFVFFFANSNIIPSRRHRDYNIRIPASLHYLKATDNEKQVAYWKAIQDPEAKSVILLHGFTRDSGVLNRRAQIYWEEGYNVYLVDNLGHGKSSSIPFPSGIRYSQEVKKLIEEEGISKPIIHGASMGAIAASCVAQLHPEIPSKIVTEALAWNFDNLYKELLRYVNIPYWLFPWIEVASRKIAWRQFKDLDFEYDVTNVSCPMFLIHSTKDQLFKPEDHYHKIVSKMGDRQNFSSWLVEDGGHTRMDTRPGYKERLLAFISD